MNPLAVADEQTKITASQILIIDDDELISEDLRRSLIKEGFTSVTVYNSAEDAFAHYLSSEPDLIIIDIHMPGVDGIEFMQKLRKSDRRAEFVPFFFITSDQRPEAKRRALQAGATDIVDKFVDEVDFLVRVSNLLKMRHLHLEIQQHNLHLEKLVYMRTEELNEAQREILERLAIASEYRDDQTAAHVNRVGNLSASLARKLDLDSSDVELIRLAAKLHDVGKIGISDSILYKPGPLTPEERTNMQQHTEIGKRILSKGNSRVVRMAAQIALTHHEKWDGTGYPMGLAGKDIPLFGRIVAVADVYDALTTERHYKAAIEEEEAAGIILSESGKHFDPEVVAAFSLLRGEKITTGEAGELTRDA